MPKYCLIFCLFFHHGLSAQPIAVMFDKMNAIFVGVPTEITIVVSDVSPGRLILMPSQGELVTIDTSLGKYQWTICALSSNKAWIILADSTPNNPIDTQFFRVKRVPEPSFKLSKTGHHGERGIYGVFDGYYGEYFYPILLGYDVTFFPKRQDPVCFHNKGARFSGDVSDYVQRLIPGDAVIFSNLSWRVGCDPTVRHTEEGPAFRIK